MNAILEAADAFEAEYEAGRAKYLTAQVGAVGYSECAGFIASVWVQVPCAI
jgi:hypothetical protein